MSGLAWVIVAVAGCGRGGSSLTPAQGVVKINGAPAANLLLQFTPAQAHGGRILSATAVSDASGRFVLTCDNGKPGAPVGTHKVTVVDNNLATEDEPGGTPQSRPPVNRIPDIFASATTTPLEVTIEAVKTEYEVNITLRR
jgi:hypothetical protein